MCIYCVNIYAYMYTNSNDVEHDIISQIIFVLFVIDCCLYFDLNFEYCFVRGYMFVVRQCCFTNDVVLFISCVVSLIWINAIDLNFIYHWIPFNIEFDCQLFWGWEISNATHAIMVPARFVITICACILIPKHVSYDHCLCMDHDHNTKMCCDHTSCVYYDHNTRMYHNQCRYVMWWWHQHVTWWYYMHVTFMIIRRLNLKNACITNRFHVIFMAISHISVCLCNHDTCAVWSPYMDGIWTHCKHVVCLYDMYASWSEFMIN